MRHCCWCIKVKTGALIIGSMQLFSLFSQFAHFNLITVALKFFTVACFLMVLFKDNEMNRMLYYVSYVIELAILYSIEFYFTAKVFTDGVPDQICEKLNNSPDQFKGTEYTDLADCEANLGKMMTKEIIVFLIIQFVVQFHFASVLRQHWKNSNLGVNKGGLVPEHEVFSGVQMQAVPNVQHSVIDSAVDDEDLDRTTQSN